MNSDFNLLIHIFNVNVAFFSKKCDIALPRFCILRGGGKQGMISFHDKNIIVRDRMHVLL